MDMNPQNYEAPEAYSLRDALDALRATPADAVTMPPAVFYGLSDMAAEDVPNFRRSWRELDADFRERTAHQLVEMGESNFELHYEAVARVLLQDPIAAVRRYGVELLWENRSIRVLDDLLNLLLHEASDVVRAQIMSMLGQFVLEGEYEEIPPEAAERAQTAAISVLNSETEGALVRRRALEAISNSSRDEVRGFIREAYGSNDLDMRVSAVYSMGRSCDRYWSATVLEELSSKDPEMQYEAVRASGQLELDDAVSVLARFSMQSEDRELQEVSIWALGEIGGDEAVSFLSQLADAIDEDDEGGLQEVIEDALHNAQLRLDFDALADEWGDM